MADLDMMEAQIEMLEERILSLERTIGTLIGTEEQRRQAAIEDYRAKRHETRERWRKTGT